MAWAKIMPNGKIRPFAHFEVSEFFRFNGDIWVKYDSYNAVNISRDEPEQAFDQDAECENIDVELKIL